MLGSFVAPRDVVRHSTPAVPQLVVPAAPATGTVSGSPRGAAVDSPSTTVRRPRSLRPGPNSGNSSDHPEGYLQDICALLGDLALVELVY